MVRTYTLVSLIVFCALVLITSMVFVQYALRIMERQRMLVLAEIATAGIINEGEEEEEQVTENPGDY